MRRFTGIYLLVHNKMNSPVQRHSDKHLQWIHKVSCTFWRAARNKGLVTVSLSNVSIILHYSHHMFATMDGHIKTTCLVGTTSTGTTTTSSRHCTDRCDFAWLTTDKHGTINMRVNKTRVRILSAIVKSKLHLVCKQEVAAVLTTWTYFTC